jgi:hypothetical protein
MSSELKLNLHLEVGHGDLLFARLFTYIAACPVMIRWRQ